MQTYQRFPITLIKGKGCWVWDKKGNKYLDAVSGIATCTLGHSNRALRRALSIQLKRVQHVSNLYQIDEQEALANWLVSKSCAESVFFCNSGAEANEAAIKLARKFGHKQRKIKMPKIMTAKESFHGRTLAALSATGQTKYQEGFEPLVQGFEYFSYNDFASFQTLLNKLEVDKPQVAAVLIEPLQGEGGVNPGDPEFFKFLREICTKKDILLIFDEVQTGMGRTGKLWGYENLGVEPDVFTLAKGLGGGHPIGALLSKRHANLFIPGEHASTFGGNPFACRAGLTVAHEIERLNLLKEVTFRCNELVEGLTKIKDAFPSQIKEIRGLGLIQGLVLKEEQEITSQLIVNEAIKHKLLLVAAGPKVIRMIPPLTIRKNEVQELLKRLELTIRSFLN